MTEFLGSTSKHFLFLLFTSYCYDITKHRSREKCEREALGTISFLALTVFTFCANLLASSQQVYKLQQKVTIENSILVLILIFNLFFFGQIFRHLWYFIFKVKQIQAKPFFRISNQSFISTHICKSLVDRSGCSCDSGFQSHSF